MTRETDYTREECLRAARDADHVATHMSDPEDARFHADLAQEWRDRAEATS